MTQKTQHITRPKIQIILGSTRKDRQGEMIAEWFRQQAAGRTEFEFEYLDLKDWPLPFYGTGDQRAVPAWQEKIAEADGYIIITPEYNHSFTAVLKNALDYGGKEWRNRPIAFVGYSAQETAAARAVEQLRLVAVELQMAPIREAVHIPNVLGALPESTGSDAMRERLKRFFAQLHWWASALRAARQVEIEA